MARDSKTPKTVPTVTRTASRCLAQAVTSLSYMDRDYNFGGERPAAAEFVDPNVVPLVVVAVPTRDFTSLAQWSELPLANGGTTLGWWDGGMMSRIVAEVLLLVNVDNAQVLAAYYIKNNRDMFTLLGRLDPQHEFTLKLVKHAKSKLSKLWSEMR